MQESWPADHLVLTYSLFPVTALHSAVLCSLGSGPLWARGWFRAVWIIYMIVGYETCSLCVVSLRHSYMKLAYDASVGL